MIYSLVRKILAKEDLILRLALAFTFLWAGIRSILNPLDWVGFVPSWVGNVVEPEVFLNAHGLLEVALGLGLILGLFKTLFASLAFLDLLGILMFYGIDDITFRDVGLTLIAFLVLTRQFKK